MVKQDTLVVKHGSLLSGSFEPDHEVCFEEEEKFLDLLVKYDDDHWRSTSS